MSVAIRHQRMRPYTPGIYIPPVQPRAPLISTAAQQASTIEGNPLVFTITRSRNITAACSIGWRVESEAGNSDFSGPLSGRFDFDANAANIKSQTISTVRRTGLQNTREIRFILENPTNCEIDGNNNIARSDLRDYVASGTPWFKDKTLRSGRLWASGPGYFKSRWRNYASQVALPDAITDTNFGDNDAKILTWNLCAGGPETPLDTISGAGQFNFAGTSTGWNYIFNDCIPNSTWMGFCFDAIPRIYNTDPNDRNYNGNAIWDEIIAGTHDNRFKGMGRRLAIQFAQRGIDMKWFLGRNFHEMQQSNFYRITVATKLKWKAANERIYDKMREGADFDLKFGFSPAKESNSMDGSLGSLASWCPSNIDFVTPSFHPGKECVNRSTYDAYINGKNGWYGLNTFAEFADSKGIPMAFMEWSPRIYNNTIADRVYQWFYDEWLNPNRENIVMDTVFHWKTLEPNQVDNEPDQTPEGKLAWKRGVEIFKTKWSGIKGVK